MSSSPHVVTLYPYFYEVHTYFLRASYIEIEYGMFNLGVIYEVPRISMANAFELAVIN